MSKRVTAPLGLVSASLLCAGGPAFAADAAGTLQLSGDQDTPRLDYLGSRTRIGVGLSDGGDFAAEVLKVFADDEDSAVIGEGWANAGAGGLKVNYHWVGDGSVKVYKAFAALDQNDEEDRKLSLGGGWERDDLFFGAYLSLAVTDERRVGRRVESVEDVLTGVDEIGAFEQIRTTTTTTTAYEHPYDHGVGVRIGRFYDGGLWRVRGGLDYEWGDYDSSQSTFSIGVERFIAGTGHSFAVTGEFMDRDGEFETEHSDVRALFMWRYAFGENYRPVRTEAAPATAQGALVVAPEPEPVEPQFRVVKNQVDMQADTFFDFDSAQLRPAGIEDLRAVAEAITTGQLAGKVSVVGHTDSTGPAAYNQGLSERRAESVREKLVQLGVSAELILTEGRGESQPKYPNDTREGRQKNRRVDIHFISIQESREALPAPPPTRQATWTREPVEETPAWLQRALFNPIQHKRRVDTYRFEKTSTEVALGEREYINRAPTTADDSASVPRNGQPVLIDVLANDTDPDGDTLTVVSVTQPAQGGTVENFGDFISFTPTPGFSGEVQFSYTAGDGEGGEATGNVTVTVVNTGPVAVADSASTTMDTPVVIDVLANDSDPEGDALTLVSVEQPANGSASIEGTAVRYVPSAGFEGTDTFTYTVREAGGETASARVTVTVEGQPNNPPVARDDAVWTYIVPSLTVDVLANDSDPDGDPLTVIGLSDLPPAEQGSFTINADGTITFTNNNWDGSPLPLIYTISDGRGGTASARLTIYDP